MEDFMKEPVTEKNLVLESTLKTVKSIMRARFEIKLVETDAGKYRVCYRVNGGEVIIGEPVSDYSLAAAIFDLKRQELEGN